MGSRPSASLVYGIKVYEQKDLEDNTPQWVEDLHGNPGVTVRLSGSEGTGWTYWLSAKTLTGGPLPASDIIPPMDADTQLEAACKNAGIPFTQPAWHILAYYG